MAEDAYSFRRRFASLSVFLALVVSSGLLVGWVPRAAADTKVSRISATLPSTLAVAARTAADDEEDDDDDDDSAYCIISSLGLMGGLVLVFGLSLSPAFRARLDLTLAEQ